MTFQEFKEINNGYKAKLVSYLKKFFWLIIIGFILGFISELKPTGTIVSAIIWAITFASFGTLEIAVCALEPKEIHYICTLILLGIAIPLFNIIQILVG